MEKISTVKGYGHLEVNGEKYPFTNQVGNVFSRVIENFLIGGFILGSISSDIPSLDFFRYFCLLAETPETNKTKIYEELGSKILSTLSVKGSYNSYTVRDSIYIAKNGTIKAGGFNVITDVLKNPLPVFNQKSTTHTTAIPFQLGSSLPTNYSLIYHPVKKAFYSFNSNGTVIKIDFDIDTFTWGQRQDFTGFNYVFNSEFYIPDNDTLATFTSGTIMRVWDFDTDTHNTVSLTGGFTLSPTTSLHLVLAWDQTVGGLRCVTTGRTSPATNGFVIYPNGLVVGNQGVLPATTSNTPVLYDDDVLWGRDQRAYKRGDTTYAQHAIQQGDGGGYLMTDYLSGMRIAPKFGLNNKDFVIGRFGAATNPTACFIYFSKMPDTYTTLLATPNIPVTVGDSVTVEYTIEIG